MLPSALHEMINGLAIPFYVQNTKDCVGIIMRQYPHGNKRNLKQGERKQLCRHTLTKFATKQILASGRLLNWKYNTDKSFLSPTFITITYGANVPEHKTAKKHLDRFLKVIRYHGYGKLYTWVAQLQTGVRAMLQGRKSYRQQHGFAIHFHIMTEHIPEDFGKIYLCNSWKAIVNEWETKNRFENSRTEYGYDCKPVFNAANYMAKYISFNKNEVIGNMWNMSKGMRELIKKEKRIKYINEIDFINYCELHEDKSQLGNTKIMICEDFQANRMMFTNNVNDVLKDLETIAENKRKVLRNKQRINNKLFQYSEFVSN